MKSLKDVSWQVSEELYRADPALSYSTLARYDREGFNNLYKLFDKIETPSLTFGSAVDSLITGGKSEFDERFLVAEFPSIPDSIVSIVKHLFNNNSTEYSRLKDIPDNILNDAITLFNYQQNWKPETRIKVIKEKGAEYYNLMYIANGRTILDTETYNDVILSVEALKTSEATRSLFADNDPYDPDTERFYQLKFKATLNGIDYRCMADEILILHDRKVIIPIDLKTSSKPEWDFYKSFIEWKYYIQAMLYWRIIRANLDNDDFYKDYRLLDYKFVVVNRKTRTPLVWDCPFTQKTGTQLLGKNKDIILRDPEDIGKELRFYLDNHYNTPIGIDINSPNNIEEWINKNL